ncbi:unnamed protein product [Larinioides sclopetarius]|uniref:Uncharacterized protein n=1 Tax=Larinioides sclopetarius TaxID=280406 RepID=A0AAV2BEA1_9ARAC
MKNLILVMYVTKNFLRKIH